MIKSRSRRLNGWPSCEESSTSLILKREQLSIDERFCLKLSSVFKVALYFLEWLSWTESRFSRISSWGYYFLKCVDKSRCDEALLYWRIWLSPTLTYCSILRNCWGNSKGCSFSLIKLIWVTFLRCRCLAVTAPLDSLRAWKAEASCVTSWGILASSVN